MKILGVALVMCLWYPPSKSGIGAGSNACVLDALAYIPNCIGSYTHDLYEAEAVQVSDKYNELLPLIHKRDSVCGGVKENLDAASKNIENSQSKETLAESVGTADVVEVAKQAAKAENNSTFVGLMIGLDKIVMFFSLVIFRIGWWSTISANRFCLACSRYSDRSNGLSVSCQNGKEPGQNGLPDISRYISMEPCSTL